jgi:ribosomal protein L11 methyltransferase
LADPARRWPALDLITKPNAWPIDNAGQVSPQDQPAWLPPHQPSSGDRSYALDEFLAAFLDDYSPTAIVDPPTPPPVDRHAWRVFFASADARDRAQAAIASSEWHARLDTQAIDVEDEGWAERSQASLAAIQVGRVIVAPPWDVPRADDTTLVIVIEPSMGFGTGHHQSTRLCLHALQAMDLAGQRVLDLGTGSGVLAIAAARLGARDVLAWDDDQDAIDAARKNAALNGVDAIVRLERADLTTATTDPAEVVLANLTGALLSRHAATIVRHAAPGARLVLSGFTEDERFAVKHAFRDLEIVREDREDGWMGLTLAMPTAATRT